MSLPPCHSRRPIEGESRLFCAHPKMVAPNNEVTPEICSICGYWREPPPETFRPFVRVLPRGPCLHLGEMIELRECRSCMGRVQVKVFSCGHPLHQETTLNECMTCPDHKPRDEEPKQPS